MKKRKKFLGALLCCIMIITALPVTSKADTVTDKDTVEIKYTNSVGRVYLSEEENLAVQYKDTRRWDWCRHLIKISMDICFMGKVK